MASKSARCKAGALFKRAHYRKNEPWRDIHGKHARIEVFADGKQIGWIDGELDCGVGPGMKYTPAIKGHQVGSFSLLGGSLREVKTAIRDYFALH
jgi:hypothetical protein